MRKPFFAFFLSRYSTETVFHRHLRHRSDDEAVRDEPEVLFPGGLEHFRFYYCGAVAGRIRAGGRAGIVGAAIVSIGKCSWRAGQAGGFLLQDHLGIG